LIRVTGSAGLRRHEPVFADLDGTADDGVLGKRPIEGENGGRARRGREDQEDANGPIIRPYPITQLPDYPIPMM
jgi:hypothetical protein